MIEPEFQIDYVDGSVFLGKSFEGDWKKVNEIPIKSFTFTINKNRFRLEGFVSYNHLIENMNIPGKSNIVSKIFIMGRKKNEACIIEFDFREGKINQQIVKIGQEYGNEYKDENGNLISNWQILSGWKKGIEDGEPKIYKG